jgi:hypothetical protein
MFNVSENMLGTVGARFGPSFVSSVNEADPLGMGVVTTSTSRVDFSFAPTLGGEYFFSKHFSLGVEAQVNFLVVGSASTDIDPTPAGGQPPDGDESQFLMSTGTGFVARVFFL